MYLQLINTLGKVTDSITAEYIEDIVEWAVESYHETYSFRWSDANYKVWEVSCMDFYPQDITYETFKHIV